MTNETKRSIGTAPWYYEIFKTIVIEKSTNNYMLIIDISFISKSLYFITLPIYTCYFDSKTSTIFLLYLCKTYNNIKNYGHQTIPVAFKYILFPSIYKCQLYQAWTPDFLVGHVPCTSINLIRYPVPALIRKALDLFLSILYVLWSDFPYHGIYHEIEAYVCRFKSS